MKSQLLRIAVMAFAAGISTAAYAGAAPAFKNNVPRDFGMCSFDPESAAMTNGMLSLRYPCWALG